MDKKRKDNLNCYCKSCRKQYALAHKKEKSAYDEMYRQKNKEKIAEYQCAYRQDHKEEAIIYKKQYFQNNKEEIAVKHRKYFEDNKEKIMENHRLYNSKHKEEITRYKREYYKTETYKKQRRKSKAVRRAREREAPNIEGFDLNIVLERDGYRCQHCSKKTRPDYKTNHSLYPNVDHIIPLSKGGDHTRKNTQCLCRQCNLEKNNLENNGDQLRMFG